MGIVENKQEIFGNIAALRTLNEGFPNLNMFNSLPSINNGKNSLNFLTDLLKSLVGFEEIKNVLVNTLSYELGNLETSIKTALKNEMKGFVNCGVDPSIPAFLQHGNTVNVVELELRRIDILGIFLVDPSSELGPLYYNDVSSGINSEDFNTFLHNTIQNPNIEQSWGQSTFGEPIISLTFNDISLPNNNVVKVTSSQEYTNRTLTELNNNFIDSINLFDVKELIPNIVDSIFGSVTVEMGKTRNQIEQEVILEEIIDSIINSDDDDVIDNSFFSFDTNTNQLLERRINDRREGRVILDTCGGIISEIPINEIISLANALNNTTDVGVRHEIILENINILSNSSAQNASESDMYNIRLNFVDTLLKKTMLAIANIVLGPKLVFLYAWNHKIVHGVDSSFGDPIEFMRQNKTLIRNILNSIRDAVITVILREVLSRISTLVARNSQNVLIEREKNKQAQLASLVGVSQDIIRTIQNLT